MNVDIMETKVVTVSVDTSVEEACDVCLTVHFPLLTDGFWSCQTLLSEGIECLVIVDSTTRPSSASPPSPTVPTAESAAAVEPASISSSSDAPWIGLFDVRLPRFRQRSSIHPNSIVKYSFLMSTPSSHLQRLDTHTPLT